MFVCRFVCRLHKTSFAFNLIIFQTSLDNIIIVGRKLDIGQRLSVNTSFEAQQCICDFLEELINDINGFNTLHLFSLIFIWKMLCQVYKQGIRPTENMRKISQGQKVRQCQTTTSDTFILRLYIDRAFSNCNERKKRVHRHHNYYNYCEKGQLILDVKEHG